MAFSNSDAAQAHTKFTDYIVVKNDFIESIIAENTLASLRDLVNEMLNQANHYTSAGVSDALFIGTGRKVSPDVKNLKADKVLAFKPQVLAYRLGHYPHFDQEL